MRHLSRKQKNYIRKHIKKNYFEKGIDKPYCFNCNEDLQYEIYIHIAKMLEFENFDSQVDNFVDEIRSVEDCRVI